MTKPSPIPLQSLLQHRQWVRNLARHLVIDEARADDLEQQTWLAAIDRPPSGDTPKAWLGTVMRNLAARMRRGEYRIDRRERVAAKRERLPATGDVVAQAELHKEVVQAVLELDPPYRETVLLRHYEGLAPRDVAKRMGVPVETVRSRGRRGLKQVRARLDGKHGGDNTAWRLALLPLARLAERSTVAAAGTTAATTGILLMTAKSKFALTALLLLILAGGAWFLFDDPAEDPGGTPPVELGEASKGEAGPMLDTKGAAKTDATSAAPAAARPIAEPAPVLPAGTAWVRVVRGEGAEAKPVKDAGVIVAAARGTTVDLLVDAWGRAEVPPKVVGFPTSIWIIDAADATIERRRTTLKPGEYLVRLPAPQAVEIRFVSTDGSVLSAEEVKRRYATAGVRPMAHLVSGAALSSADRSLALETVFGLSTGTSFRTPLVFDGERIRLALAPSEGSWQILVERPGAAAELSNSFRVGSADDSATIQMPLPDTAPTMRLRAVDAEGRVIVGATATPHFEIGDDAAFFATASKTTGPNGEVVIPIYDRGDRKHQRGPTWWVTKGDRVGKLSMWSAGSVAPDTTKDVMLYRTATVEGRAFLPTGGPAVGKTIIWGSKGYRRRTEVDADGQYRLEGIPAGAGRRVQMWLIDDLVQAALRSARVQCKAGETSTHDFGKAVTAAEIGTIEGRVTEAGAPLPGILLMVSRDAMRAKGRTASTDAEGRFRIVGIPPGEYQLRVLLGDFRISDDFKIVSRKSFTVEGGNTHAFDFDLPGGHVEVTLLDAETGKPIAGGLAVARPADKTRTTDLFPGFRTRLGWAEATDEHGVVHLRALPTDTDLHLLFGAKSGYERGERKGVRAGTADAPTRIELKLKKRP